MLLHHPYACCHPPDLHIFLNNHGIRHHQSPPAQAPRPWCYTFFHPSLVTPCTDLISRSSAMLGLLRPLHSYFHFSSRCLLTVYLCYIRPLLEYGCSSFASLSVRSGRQLEAVQQKALSPCCVDSACISSLPERRSSILLRLFFSILDDNVPDHKSGFCQWPFVHTATTRTLRNSSAIRLPRPRTSTFPTQTLFDLKKVGFSLDSSQISRKYSRSNPLSPNLFFGVVIFKTRAEFGFFSPFPWESSMHNSFFTKF